jgi:hypothetical protein
MATTKSTTAKKVAPKKTAAKKTVAKKTVARKAPAKKAAAKTTVAKKTVARKAPAKKAAAKTTVAKKTVARKAPVTTTASNKAASTVAAVRGSISSAARDADGTVKQYAAVANDQFADVAEFMRGIVDVSVGIPFVVQSRIAVKATIPTVDIESVKALLDDVKARLAEAPSVDFDAVKSFIDEAKGEGHARVAAFQTRVEPLAGTVSKRIDEATTKFEAQLSAQMSDLVETSIARLRSLYAA